LYWRLVIVKPFEILVIRFCSNLVRYLLFILVQIHTAVSKLLSIIVQSWQTLCCSFLFSRYGV
jgi:hypothetical protein